MLNCKYAKFSIPKRITYLNCAYMSPILKTSEKAGIRGLRMKRNPAEVTPQDFFTETELLRAEFAKLINASEPKRIVVIPSVSYGMASVAKNIKLSKGQHILVAAEQFPSNVFPWQKMCEEYNAELKFISPEAALQERGKNWNIKILEAINSNTKVVALAHTHWSDGTKFDLEAIRKRSREVNALLIIDGTQSVGALPFDVQKIQPDALVCAGYKWLLGPYSIGLAYYGEYFDNGTPLEENWINRKNSEDFAGLISYEQNYQSGALRYEVGEHSNFISVPMLHASIKQLNKWHVGNVQEYCSAISQDAVNKLREHGFWIEDEQYRGSHLFGIRMPEGKDLNLIKDKLLKEKIYVSYRSGAIRVSPNVYNDEEDLQRLVKVLIKP